MIQQILLIKQALNKVRQNLESLIRIISMDFKFRDIGLVIAGPILIAPFATGYIYLGLVAIYAVTAGYFRYVRS